VDRLRTVRAVKETVPPTFLPVVMVCASDDPGVRVAALRAGADDCLASPCHLAELTARVASLLRIKSSHDGLQLEKAELERLSMTDALTGAFNRRYFQIRLDEEIERARRHGDPLSLLLLDLDHFKRVNDRHGHDAGDAALRATAGLLAAQLRRVDVCTRWGGEEFAVVMPNTPRAGALCVAERILQALRALAIALPAPRSAERAGTLSITGSIGLSSYSSRDGARSASEIVRAADAALYRAKTLGRDRVCAAWKTGRRAASTRSAFERPLPLAG
jgi:two-component system cell cycle response regulator